MQEPNEKQFASVVVTNNDERKPLHQSDNHDDITTTTTATPQNSMSMHEAAALVAVADMSNDMDNQQYAGGETADAESLPDSIPVPRSRLSRRSSAARLGKPAARRKSRMSAGTATTTTTVATENQNNNSNTATANLKMAPPVASRQTSAASRQSSGGGSVTTTRSRSIDSTDESLKSWQEDLLKAGVSLEEMQGVMMMGGQQSSIENHNSTAQRIPAAVGAAAKAPPENNSNEYYENHNNHHASSRLEGFADEDVLEQYRIMAHHEAHQRVKQNLGYDPSDEIIISSQQPNACNGGGTTGDLHSAPALGLAALHNDDDDEDEHDMAKPCAPTGPIPLSSLSTHRAMRQRNSTSVRQPDLQVGRIRSSSGSTNEDLRRMVVRCLGCHKKLTVSNEAVLVACPECATISSATSTRR